MYASTSILIEAPECMHICKPVHICTYMRIYVNLCMSICAYMHVVEVCIYVSPL